MFTDLRPYSKDAAVPWNHVRLKTVARNTNDHAAEVPGLSLTLDDVEGWTGRIIRDRSAFGGDGRAFVPGDVIFGKLRPYLAKVAAPSEPGRCVDEFLVLRPDGALAATAFMAALLRSHPFIQKVVSLTYGAQMPRAEWSVLGGIEVALPPIDEQAAIVKYLAHAHHRIDRAIAAKRKLVSLLEAQKQAVINQAVTRGLDPNGPQQDSGVPSLGHLPAAWSHTTVGRLQVLVTSGSRGWSEHYSNVGPLFIQSGNLGRDLALNFARTQRVDLPHAAEGMRTAVREDDILVCITGALTGNVVHVRDPLGEAAYVNQHVALIRLRSSVANARFVAYVLHSETGQRQFGAAEYGGTKQGLGLADIKMAAIPVPSLAEQMAIVAYIDREIGRVGAAIYRCRREVDLLREFRTRLTSDVVTGQVDVRHIAATLPDLDPDELIADVSGTVDDLADEAAEFLEDVDA